MMQQAVALARKPHVIIATPGRLVDHLENTRGFSLRTIGELVLDEADRMLSMDFEEELNRILDVIPRSGCRTSLFSATMTSKVQKLQRASLTSPSKWRCQRSSDGEESCPAVPVRAGKAQGLLRDSCCQRYDGKNRYNFVLRTPVMLSRYCFAILDSVQLASMVVRRSPSASGR